MSILGHAGTELTRSHDTIIREVWYIQLGYMSKQSATKKRKVNPPLSKSSGARKANKSFAGAGSPKKRSSAHEKALPDTSAIPWLRTGTSSS